MSEEVKGPFRKFTFDPPYDNREGECFFKDSGLDDVRRAYLELAHWSDYVLEHEYGDFGEEYNWVSWPGGPIVREEEFLAFLYLRQLNKQNRLQRLHAYEIDEVAAERPWEKLLVQDSP